MSAVAERAREKVAAIEAAHKADESKRHIAWAADLQEAGWTIVRPGDQNTSSRTMTPG